MKGISMLCLACRGVWWQTFGAHACVFCGSDRIMPAREGRAAA